MVGPIRLSFEGSICVSFEQAAHVSSQPPTRAHEPEISPPIAPTAAQGRTAHGHSVPIDLFQLEAIIISGIEQLVRRLDRLSDRLANRDRQNPAVEPDTPDDSSTPHCQC
jgi:hypothetical protein